MPENPFEVQYHQHNGQDSPKIPFGVLESILNAEGVSVTAQFDKTNTTLANITGLSRQVSAGKKYAFEAVLFIDANGTGGSKYALSGTCTVTTLLANIMLLDNSTDAYTINNRVTALDSAAGQAGTTAGICIIKGFIQPKTGGTLTVQFAQNAASGTSSILAGSYFQVKEIS